MDDRDRGLWKPRRQRLKAVPVWRERRAACGELVMMDHSPFRWLEERRPPLQLIALVDDASSRFWGRFVEQDSTEQNRRALEGWLRRDELCDVNLCPDSPDPSTSLRTGFGSCCGKCPLNRLDAAQHSEAGQLLRRALDLRAAIKMGIHLYLDEIAADEFYAMLAIEGAQEQYEKERAGKS